MAINVWRASGVRAGTMPLPQAGDIKGQIRYLRGMGIDVDDVSAAETFLRDVSFYRIRGYVSGLDASALTQDSKFPFGTLTGLYEFDTDLRRLMFGVIEKIELGFRSRLVNYFTREHGPLGYLDYNNLYAGRPVSKKKRSAVAHGAFVAAQNNPTDGRAALLMDEIVFCIGRNTGNKITPRSDHRYGAVQMPFCEAAEFLPFGILTKLFKDMKNAEKQEFCEENYADMDWHSFDSWIGCIGYVRNMCAHHNRLCNVMMRAAKPTIYTSADRAPESKMADNGHLFAAMLCMKGFLDDADWGGFVSCLRKLLKSHPEVSLDAMGFPTDWEDRLLNQVVA